jgi:hypothetical protein
MDPRQQLGYGGEPALREHLTLSVFSVMPTGGPQAAPSFDGRRIGAVVGHLGPPGSKHRTHATECHWAAVSHAARARLQSHDEWPITIRVVLVDERVREGGWNEAWADAAGLHPTRLDGSRMHRRSAASGTDQEGWERFRLL